MLTRRYGAEAVAAYNVRRKKSIAKAAEHDQHALMGNFDTIYQFGQGLIDETQITINKSQVTLPGFAQPIELAATNRFADMCD
jgi:acetoacetyl-[acyl-carrier protein] synthase